jgi:ABC-type uncharacterized transport system substrate-binding protein
LLREERERRRRRREMPVIKSVVAMVYEKSSMSELAIEKVVKEAKAAGVTVIPVPYAKDAFPEHSFMKLPEFQRLF